MRSENSFFSLRFYLKRVSNAFYIMKALTVADLIFMTRSHMFQSHQHLILGPSLCQLIVQSPALQ